jgi:hypothetical protein
MTEGLLQGFYMPERRGDGERRLGCSSEQCCSTDSKGYGENRLLRILTMSQSSRRWLVVIGKRWQSG